MSRRSGTSDEFYELIKFLSSRIECFEQLTNETGASPIDPYKSETIETTLLGTVSALRRIRNAEQPVNKLPPELLGQIFSLVPGPLHRCHQAGGLRRDFGPHAIAPLADVLPLLNVCSRWRSVAASSSFLWSTIDNHSSQAFSMSSRYRPTSGPLNAHIRNTFHPPHDDILCDLAAGMRLFHQLNAVFLRLLQNEGHRIHEFNVEVPAILLPALTAFPGETLQTCHLRLLENSAYSLEAVQPLFCGCTPKLKSLIVESLLFIPTNDFPSLTHLILDGAVIDTNPEGPYTFINFLRFLSRCPNLEVLHLFALDVARLQDLPNFIVDAPVQLPRLRKFSNEESLVDQTRRYRLPHISARFRRAILAHLQLSPHCVIRLATILPHELEQTFNSLPFDTPFTSLYLGAHAHPSELYTSEPNGVERECFSLMATNPPHQCGVRIDFQMPGTRYAPRNVTTQSARACLRDGIRSVPSLARAHELWVVPAAALLLGEPCSLFSGLPYLATLVLGLYPLAQDAPEDVRDHWEPLRALEVRDDCVIPCPRLRTLCVYLGGDAEEHVVQLYHMLLSRGEAGFPVRRLVVGFYQRPTSSLLELVEGLWGLVEDFTLLEDQERCPDDLLWGDRLPFVCRDRSEWNTYWPAWM